MTSSIQTSDSELTLAQLFTINRLRQISQAIYRNVLVTRGFGKSLLSGLVIYDIDQEELAVISGTGSGIGHIKHCLLIDPEGNNRPFVSDDLKTNHH